MSLENTSEIEKQNTETNFEQEKIPETNEENVDHIDEKSSYFEEPDQRESSFNKEQGYEEYFSPDDSQLGGQESVKTSTEAVEKTIENNRAEVNENSWEGIEATRKEKIIKDLESHEELKPENWQKLDNWQRDRALSRAGKACCEHYPEMPGAPSDLEPLSKEMEPGLNGRYVHETRVDGEKVPDWDIKENKELLNSDDPYPAIKTYLHEYRHSYQDEIIHIHRDTTFDVPDKDFAETMSKNKDNYKKAPSRELFYENETEYHERYEQYREQPLEKDAEEFAVNVTEELKKAHQKNNWSA